GVQYNVFGIPIGPDDVPLEGPAAEAFKSPDAKSEAPAAAAQTNKAIVNEAVKAAARTHPGLPAGFTIPPADPSLFTLPQIADHALLKARPAAPSQASPLFVNHDMTPPASAPAQPPVVAAVPEPSVPTAVPEPPAAIAAPEAPAAPAKGKRGRKAKTVEVAP